MKKIITIILLAFISCNFYGAAAGRLQYVSNDPSAFPKVTGEFFIVKSTGAPETNLTSSLSAFSLTDNGAPVSGFSFVDPGTQISGKSLSTVISFDLAMSKANLTIAKNIAASLVNRIKYKNIETAIHSFAGDCYLNLDFTSDTNKLYKAITSVSADGGSNINNGFTQGKIGSIALSAGGKNEKKIVVLLTDKSSICDYATIASQANASNVSVYIVVIGAQASDSYILAANQSSGAYYSNASLSDAENIGEKVIYKARGFKTTQVVWESPNLCDSLHTAKLSITLDNILNSAENAFPVSYDLKPNIGFSKTGLNFNLFLGITELDVNVFSRRGVINIDSFGVDNAKFAVAPNSACILRAGVDTLKLKVTYKTSVPLDSELIYANLIGYGKLCGINELPIVAGFPNTPPTNSNIKITYPDSSRKTVITGDSLSIRWGGALPDDLIQLEYRLSSDTSKKYQTIVNDTSGLEYLWQVPNAINGDSLYVKLIQLWPNNAGKTSDLKHKDKVNAAKFSFDGSYAVTVSDDSTVVVWNANKAKELWSSPKIAKFNYACFSYPESGSGLTKYIAVAGSDSSIHVWDWSNNIQTKVRDGNGQIRGLCFTSDNKYLASAGDDGSVYIWKCDWTVSPPQITKFDSVKKAFVSSVSPYFYALTCINFSPNDSKMLISGNNTPIVKMWKFANGKIDTNGAMRYYHNKISGVKYPVVHSCYFNSNGTMLATAGDDGYANVWKVSDTSAPIASFNHKDTTLTKADVYCASFYPTMDQEIVITGCNDNKPRLWKISTPNTVYKTLDFEHTNKVKTAFFNIDGSRILTASEDSTAKIWNLDQRDLQTCVAGPFLIEGPNFSLAADTINFGESSMSESKDTTFTCFFKNNLKSAISLNKLQVSGKDSADFTIISSFSPQVIQSGDSIGVALKFKPTKIGDRESSLIFGTSARTLISDLKGVGIDDSLDIVKYVDFGVVELGSFKDTAIVFNLKYSPSVPKSIYFEKGGPDTVSFNLLNTTGEYSAQENDNKLIIRFVPSETGLTSTSYIISGYGKRKIFLYGKGILPFIDTLQFSVDEIAAKTGEKIEIPIRVKNIAEAGIQGSYSGFGLALSFNSTIFAPIGTFTKDSTKLDKMRTIWIETNSGISADSIIYKLEGTAALGNIAADSIYISESRPLNAQKANILEKNGYIKLSNICEQDGLRLFDNSVYLSLNAAAPNPVAGGAYVDFTLREDGATKLYVVNSLGAVAKTLIDANLTKGEYRSQFNVSELPQGSYFLILESPNGRVLNKLEVSK